MKIHYTVEESIFNEVCQTLVQRPYLEVYQIMRALESCQKVDLGQAEKPKKETKGAK